MDAPRKVNPIKGENENIICLPPAKTPQKLAKTIHSKGGIIAAMCVGVLPVAKAGLLNGKRATTYPFSKNHDNPLYLKNHGCRYTGNPIEEDNRIISCAGPAQSIEVVLLMLEKILEPENVIKIKKLRR